MLYAPGICPSSYAALSRTSSTKTDPSACSGWNPICVIRGIVDESFGLIFCAEAGRTKATARTTAAMNERRMTAPSTYYRGTVNSRIRARDPKGALSTPPIERSPDALAPHLEDAAHFPGGHADGIARPR